MTPQSLFVLVMGISVLNGLLHQLAGSVPFVLLLRLAPIWWPEIFGFYLEALVYAATLIIATATLLLGGIPAALYERARRLDQPTPAAMWLWFAGVLAVAAFMFPTLAFRLPS
jgi:hypothetical protein